MSEAGEGPQVTDPQRLPFALRSAAVLVCLPLLILISNDPYLALAVASFYLYGSIPYATLVSRRFVGRRMEDVGSGSVGVANTYMNAGMVPGTLTVIGEISKGLLPLFVSYLLFDYVILASSLMLCASLLGTNFSIFNRLLGGMGTTMVLWSLLVVSTFSFLGVIAVLLVSKVVVKDTFWMTVITYASGPMVVYLVDGRWPLVGFAVFAAAIYILKFRRSLDEFERSKALKG
jgi:glycerol-3-phosphate acyltransferase PlsY